MTIEEINKVLALLKAAWPQQPILAQTPLAWQLGLGSMSLEMAMLGVKACIRTSHFFPSVAELREAALDELASLPEPERTRILAGGSAPAQLRPGTRAWEAKDA